MIDKFIYSIFDCLDKLLERVDNLFTKKKNKKKK